MKEKLFTNQLFRNQRITWNKLTVCYKRVVYRAIRPSIILDVNTERQTNTEPCTIHTLVNFLPLHYSSVRFTACMCFWDSTCLVTYTFCSTHKLWKVKSIVQVSVHAETYMWACVRKKERRTKQVKIIYRNSTVTEKYGKGKKKHHPISNCM